ncbi:MAG: OmpA family protein [Acidobacteriota bacterium]|nr:OmpA family protein [Acidobacteriota bacterium]
MSNGRKHAKGNNERWLVSYADFITLLFAFFVVMYAVSKSQKHTEADVSQSVHSALQQLGMMPQFSRNKGDVRSNDLYVSDQHLAPETRVLTPAGVQRELQRVQAQLQKLLAVQIHQHLVSLQLGPNGLVISLHEAGFFASGSATPKESTSDTLTRIATALRQTGYEVRVEGHTDNVPIYTEQFHSNWELSAARATGIARLLLELRGVPPERLSAAGYGEFHPIASNATAEGRAENRRVDLVVFPRVEINPAQPGSPAPSGLWRTIMEGDQSEK